MDADVELRLNAKGAFFLAECTPSILLRLERQQLMSYRLDIRDFASMTPWTDENVERVIGEEREKKEGREGETKRTK
jgi:hypothetical protein